MVWPLLMSGNMRGRQVGRQSATTIHALAGAKCRYGTMLFLASQVPLSGFGTSRLYGLGSTSRVLE